MNSWRFSFRFVYLTLSWHRFEDLGSLRVFFEQEKEEIKDSLYLFMRRENCEPKFPLTVGARFLLSYTKQIYFVLSRVCILFCFIVFGRQNVVETSEINRWLRHSWLLVNRYKFSGNSHLFCNVRQKGWGKRKCEIASKKPNRQKSFSCLTNNDFDHDDGVKCNGDDSTVVVVEPLLLPCGWYNPGGRAPLNEKGASGDDRHTHLQV